MEGAILVTGANGGIGQYIVEHLLAGGHKNVVCHYRSDGTRVRSILEASGLDPDRHVVSGDLASEASVAAMEVAIKANFPGVSSLLNVAGSSSNGMSWKLSLEAFRKAVDDSLTSTFLCTRQFAPYMRESGFGRIVNFSSIVGVTGVVGASHYAAAKAGIIGFTKSVAQELASKGITVNAIALGYFDTGLINDVTPALQEAILQRIPAGRFGSRDDIGAAIDYLLGEHSRFYTGQVLHLNGGQF